MEKIMLIISMSMLIGFMPEIFQMYKSKHLKTMIMFATIQAISLTLAVDMYVKSIIGQ